MSESNLMYDALIDYYKGVWPVKRLDPPWLVIKDGFAVRPTKEKFEARKAERQNKPKWGDAPEYANWLAQDGEEFDGHWHWFKDKPEITENQFGIGTMPVDYDCAGFGEVIGDWRDTLEQRPAEPEKEFGESNDLADWYDYDKQEQCANVPAGVLCEAIIDKDYEMCSVIAYHEDMAWISARNGSRHPVRMISDLKFRPLNYMLSHKDRTIGKALSVGVTVEPQSKRDIMERLYEAKMLVIPEK